MAQHSASAAQPAPVEWTDDALIELLRERSVVVPTDERLLAFVDAFKARHGEGLSSIVFYGSRLSATNQSDTSLFDFFLFADDYRAFYRLQRRRDAALNRFLAPNTYYLKVGDGRCKYNVVSSNDFDRETSERAHDLFHAGRFSKRVAILWSRDDATERRLAAQLFAAMKTVFGHALARLPARFTREELLHGVIALSYAAEVRVESDAKVTKLLEAERPFYELVYGALLEREVAAGRVSRDPSNEDAFERAEVGLARRRKATERLLAKSRRRMYVRWFKYMATLDNWTDLLIEKVERTKGIKIELTPLQRRYPYIFGWSHFFKMMRKGMVK